MNTKQKSKIDTLEHLDDIEKFQGKWRNHYIARGVYFNSLRLHDSESMANNAAHEFMSKGEVGKDGEIQVTRGQEKVIKCKPSEIIYIGAMPEKT